MHDPLNVRLTLWLAHFPSQCVAMNSFREFEATYCCVYSARLPMMDTETPKHVEFYSQNKFEKLVHLVGFIIRTTQSIPML